MKLIKYPRRYEWENLLQTGQVAVYADETADPSKINHIILSATQRQCSVMTVSSHNLLIEALLDEIDKSLINMNQKQLEVAAFNGSSCVLVKNERVAIELLRTIHPAQLILFCSNAEPIASIFRNTTTVVSVNEIDNIL